MKNTINYKIITFLIIVLPFAFITGPFLPDLILSLVGLNFIFLTIRYNLYSHYKNQFTLFFLIFYLYMLLRGITSEDIYLSLIDYDGPLFYFRYLFFILAVNFYLKEDPNNFYKIFSSLLLSILFVSIDGYFQFFNTSNLFGMITKDGNRLTGIFGKEQVLGHYLSYIIPITIILFYYLFRNKKNLIFYFFALFVFGVFCLAFISGDRTGFLKLTLFLIGLIFFEKYFRFYGLMIIGTSIIIFALLINFSDKSAARFDNTLSDIKNNTYSFIPISPGHEELLLIGYKIFQENKIFGKGPQAYRVLCKKNNDTLYGKPCTSHVHNYYMQILSELGLIGLSLILFIYFLFIKYFFENLFKFLFGKKEINIPLTLVTIYFLLTFMPIISNANFYNNWVNSMICFTAAIGYTFYKRNNEK